ncbi:hypothetical protein DITRI_Ditri07aG0027300 [Diplodiscus trichospermus]
MEDIRGPFKGIIKDFKGRSACHKQDWASALRSGFRILALTTYIFFASALPVIDFREQLSRDTDGTLGTVELTLASTAICGIIHSIFGGQPLLIVGVAEPTITMYTYLYSFSKGRPVLGRELFFGLGFMDLRMNRSVAHSSCFIQCMLASSSYCRLWGSPSSVVLDSIVLHNSWKSWLWSSQEAIMSTSLGTCIIISLDSDKGMQDMGKVPVMYILAAFIPAMMVAGLYFFDHSVASQMAQQKEFNLKKPSAYHYDILVLEVMTLICGLLGISPSNGVLPQSPMHTKSLAVLKRQFPSMWTDGLLDFITMDAIDSGKNGKECQGRHVATSKQLENLWQNASRPISVDKELKNLKEAVMKGAGEEDAKENVDLEKHIEAFLPVRVNEQPVAVITCGTFNGCSTSGILFPLSFFLLISIRQHILPKLFQPEHLQELDASEYEETTGTPRNFSISLKVHPEENPRKH